VYKSFEIINNFVKELWGFELIKEHKNHSLSRVKELKNAREAMISMIQSLRKPLPDEFIKYLYPLIESSLQWNALEEKEEITGEFLEKCKQRVNTQSNFYGTIFEIDMASRCLLCGWNIDFVEDYSKKGKQIDFLIFNKSKVAGVECLSKRYADDDLTIAKINKNISEKAKKFKPECIAKLGIPLDERLLVIDLTTSYYSSPKILKDLEGIKISSLLDAVIFTWREDIKEGNNHSLRVKYKILGNTNIGYFPVSYASEFHLTNNGPVFFIRSYIEPEPAFKSAGPLESLKENGKRKV